ncbi:hypothetical protein NNRS527_01834 [Nitrosospira sp. NRS527]|nr:hypothetical protein NNRS527_01834 [Nitrosospira sp. NRS527]
MNTIVEKLREAYCLDGVAQPTILCNCSENQEEYDQQRQIFNRRFQFMPAAIVLCVTTEQVSVVVRFTRKHTLPLRVRSGGHDHEGECSGTDTILLDLSKMNEVEIDPARGITHIQPGTSFQNLTTKLADDDVMIPHGTCGTVCIAGYTMGGGWGPWTRKHGMCCESVVGATLVLGDGTIRKLSMDGDLDERELLWAIKGGGGFSYGIVTELVIKTFELPFEMIKFQIEWNKYCYVPKNKVFAIRDSTPVPTLTVLQAWEAVIASTDPAASQLVGTNLKISARHHAREEGPFNPDTISHNCMMYGYWEGDENSLREFIRQRFEFTGRYTLTIRDEDKAGRKYKHLRYGDHLMSSWDRYSFHNMNRLKQGLEGTPFPPDEDQPGPHKITSRLVDAQGLGKEGHYKLLESLTSPLVLPGNEGLGLYTYITLGAITGNYYQNVITPEQKTKSAFPYKDKLFTIQYQTWWNETEEQKEGQNNHVYTRINRALDWMDVCRDYDIPNTSGAFISFKDSSVPTRTYFDKSYEDLVKIKQAHVKDPDNQFRSRKTII